MKTFLARSGELHWSERVATLPWNGPPIFGNEDIDFDSTFEARVKTENSRRSLTAAVKKGSFEDYVTYVREDLYRRKHGEWVFASSPFPSALPEEKWSDR